MGRLCLPVNPHPATPRVRLPYRPTGCPGGRCAGRSPARCPMRCGAVHSPACRYGTVLPAYPQGCRLPVSRRCAVSGVRRAEHVYLVTVVAAHPRPFGAMLDISFGILEDAMHRRTGQQPLCRQRMYTECPGRKVQDKSHSYYDRPNYALHDDIVCYCGAAPLGKESHGPAPNTSILQIDL